MSRSTRRARGTFGVFVLSLTISVLSGCTDFLDDLVSVDAPDRITADTYESPQNAAIIMAGVVADFECALTNYVVAAGIAGDEIMITDALTAPELLDKRQWETRGLGAAWAVSTCTGRSEATPAIYRPLATARWQADNLLGLLDQWGDQVSNRNFLVAKAAAYAGYALILLGEVMCEVPIDVGPAQTPAQIFELASERFTRALAEAQAAGSSADEFRSMALVGLARARLNLGDLSGAAQAAGQVPAGFVKNAVYSTVSPRRYNVIFDDVEGNTTTIGPSYRGLLFAGQADPRVPVFDTGRITPGVNLPLWDQTKYPSRSAPIAIASHDEAQLIHAEAALAAGDAAAAVAIINALHAKVGLPPFGSGDPDEIRAQLLHERRAEMFLEGHRFGDMRRYQLPLDPPPGTPYHTGGEYTAARCFPIPGIEIDGNPNVS